MLTRERETLAWSHVGKAVEHNHIHIFGFELRLRIFQAVVGLECKTDHELTRFPGLAGSGCDVGISFKLDTAESVFFAFYLVFGTLSWSIVGHCGGENGHIAS